MPAESPCSKQVAMPTVTLTAPPGSVDYGSNNDSLQGRICQHTTAIEIESVVCFWLFLYMPVVHIRWKPWKQT